MESIFVSCPPGLEPLLAQELESLHIAVKQGVAGVFVPKEMAHVYKINYLSRLATRVFWPLAHFPCKDRMDLYDQAKKINWSLYLTAQTTFAIDANVSHPNLRNSLFAALVVKDAICDQFRDKTGVRPSIDVKNPDIQLNLFIHGGKATLSLDTSCAPLYKRGYRKEESVAPLQESLAAAILRKIGYKSSDILYDPFCGSGTFLMEAAMIASNTPAGFFRNTWGFKNLPEYSEKEWLKVQEDAAKKRTAILPSTLFGSDLNSQAISLCRKESAFTQFDISFTNFDIKNLNLTFHPTLVVTNPPYGKRLQSSTEPYALLGAFLKKHPGIKAAVVCPEDRLILAAQHPFKKIFTFSNGGIPVNLYCTVPSFSPAAETITRAL